MTDKEKAEIAWMALHHATSILENLYRTGDPVGKHLGFEREDVYRTWGEMLKLCNKIHEVMENEENV